jgi:hypothetical protein
MFTINRSVGLVPNYAPAASPWVRRRLSPWPPHRGIELDFGVAHLRWARAANQPMSTRFRVGGRT